MGIEDFYGWIDFFNSPSLSHLTEDEKRILYKKLLNEKEQLQYQRLLLVGGASGGAGTAESQVPISIFQPWYDSLSVKPSAGLWNDLKTLGESLVAGGISSEFDFLAILAAMETNEQRLRPLISTSGVDITAVNSPTLDVNGVTGNGTSSYLDLGWNPFSHGVKYTLNNACLGVYHSTAGTSGQRRLMGATGDNGVALTGFSQILRTTTVFTGVVNQLGTAATIVNNLTTFGLKSIRRIDDSNIIGRSNTTDGATVISASSALPNHNFGGCCYNAPAPTGTGFSSFSNATIRCFFMGSNAIQSNNVLYNALTTFFAARGLTTF